MRAVLASGLIDASDDPWLVALSRRASIALRTSSAAVTIVYDDCQLIVAASGMSTGLTRRATSFCGHAIFGDIDPFIVPDAMQDVRFAGNPYVGEDRMLRFYAGALIRARSGQPLGAVCAFDPSPRATLTPREAATLRDLADEVAAALPYRRHAPAETTHDDAMRAQGDDTPFI